MLMHSWQCLHPIVSRDQYTNNSIYSAYVKYRSINTSCHSNRPSYISVYYVTHSTLSVYRYIIPNVNPSIMLSGPFHSVIVLIIRV